MLAFDHINAVVPNCGNLLQRFLRSQPLQKLHGTELHRLGDDNDIRIHGDHTLETCGLVALESLTRRRINSPGRLDN